MEEGSYCFDSSGLIDCSLRNDLLEILKTKQKKTEDIEDIVFRMNLTKSEIEKKIENKLCWFTNI